MAGQPAAACPPREYSLEVGVELPSDSNRRVSVAVTPAATQTGEKQAQRGRGGVAGPGSQSSQLPGITALPPPDSEMRGKRTPSGPRAWGLGHVSPALQSLPQGQPHLEHGPRDRQLLPRALHIPQRAPLGRGVGPAAAPLEGDTLLHRGRQVGLSPPPLCTHAFLLAALALGVLPSCPSAGWGAPPPALPAARGQGSGADPSCLPRAQGTRVLVHCKMGVSRSAATVVAYAMKQYGWSLEQALRHVQELRPIARPNPGFLRQLQTYQGILTARYGAGQGNRGGGGGC